VYLCLKNAEPLAVMLNSILENKVSKNPIKIYVIASDLSPKNKSLLAKTVGKFNLKVAFIQIDPSIYKDFKAVYYLTKETILPYIHTRFVRRKYTKSYLFRQ